MSGSAATYDVPPISPSTFLLLYGTNSAETAPDRASRFRFVRRHVLGTSTAIDDSMLVPVRAGPPWAHVLALRAQSIGKLARGWDGPGSVAIDRGLLIEAIWIVRNALTDAPNAVAPFLVPGGDGSLQVEWHEKNGELEFDLAVDGSRFIWIRDHRSGEEIEGDDDRADALFSRWAPRLASVVYNDCYVPSATNSAVSGAYAGSSFYSDNSIT